MTALLMDKPERLGSALCHHFARDPPRMSAPVQAHYGIYRNPHQGVGAISGARSAALNHPVTGRFPPTYST
jgi:hypothetical protein